MDEVARSGEPVTVTKRGKPVVRVVPAAKRPASVFGFRKGRMKIVGDIVAPLDVEWDAALTRLLLDTTALLWLGEESERLGGMARAAIAEAAREGALLVSAISFWELALLVTRKRVALPDDAGAWRADSIASGIIEIPVTGAIGINGVALQGLHQDAADRIIVATALAEQATLVTADRRLLRWKGKLDRLDAER
jgi:PIN domain nuclease of toxin-antitoxin system/antitoxin (DNA-binding transcriptional repressor) of toxin-antitoxin stability system